MLPIAVTRNQLDQALSRGDIRDPVDRAGIINDALVLARAGYMPTSAALGISKHLHDEQEYVVWSSALKFVARARAYRQRLLLRVLIILSRSHARSMMTHTNSELARVSVLMSNDYCYGEYVVAAITLLAHQQATTRVLTTAIRCATTQVSASSCSTFSRTQWILLDGYGC